MDQRIGIIGIVIKDLSCAEQVNAILHEHATGFSTDATPENPL